MEITYAFEGGADEAVIRRLIEHVGGTPGRGFGGNGKARLLNRLRAYDEASKVGPWFVLVDLDRPGVADDCPVLFRKKHLPEPHPTMCFRIAVRQVEAWLMSDRERFAHYFGVPIKKVPVEPERIANPKEGLIFLARHSKRREIARDLVPKDPSMRSIGPGYNAWLIQYVQDTGKGWRPEVASIASESLARAIMCLRKLMNARK